MPLPITQELINLTKDKLSSSEQETLVQIIDSLFDNMARGHSCYAIDNHDSKLLKILNKSSIINQIKLTGEISIKPLTLLFANKNTFLLYLTRYFYYERSIAKQINILNNKSTLESVKIIKVINKWRLSNTNFPSQEQLLAVQSCSQNQLSIITGGPGTGKTTTVLLILILLIELYMPLKLKIVICAPTGKAASRVRESITNNINSILQVLNLDNDYFLSAFSQISYQTIHKLLGYRANDIYFKHNQDNLLDADIIIIDESSMISLPLFYKLLSAINVDKIKHIIFIGDKNQLSSVEEGYVFASIIDYYLNTTQSDLFIGNYINQLSVGKRNSGIISEFANNILTGEKKHIINSTAVEVKPTNLLKTLNQLLDKNTCFGLIEYVDYVQNLDNIDILAIFKLINQFVVLCLTNHGSFGVNNLNLQIENIIKQKILTQQTWYNGRIIIILENNYQLKLNNGDIGFCLIKDMRPTIYFEDGRTFFPEILPKYQLAYALTIHKSQGSEYDNVAVIFPENSVDNMLNLFSRELLYTAVTRARNKVIIYANETELFHAIDNTSKRKSGLKYLLSM